MQEKTAAEKKDKSLIGILIRIFIIIIIISFGVLSLINSKSL